MYETELLTPVMAAPADAPLHVRLIGRFRSHGGFRWEQVSPHYVLHCVTAGSGVVEEDGHGFAVGPGDLFLFRPGRHYRYHDVADDPWRYEFLSFGGHGLSVLDGIAGVQGAALPSGHNAGFWDRLASLCQLYDAPALSFPAAVAASWGLLATLSTSPDGPVPLGARIRDHLLALPTALPRVDQLAFQFGVDRTTLYRAFRAETGQSIKRWIDAQRLARARHLLEVTDAPIKEVARLCGYRDALYFSRRFRDETGQAPSTFRAAHCRGDP